jgi:hypothetical protein
LQPVAPIGGDAELDPVTVAKGKITLLVFVAKLDVHFLVVGSAVAQAARKWVILVASQVSLKWFQNLATDHFGADVFKHDAARVKTSYVACYFFALKISDMMI